MPNARSLSLFFACLLHQLWHFFLMLFLFGSVLYGSVCASDDDDANSCCAHSFQICTHTLWITWLWRKSLDFNALAHTYTNIPPKIESHFQHVCVVYHMTGIQRKKKWKWNRRKRASNEWRKKIVCRVRWFFVRVWWHSARFRYYYYWHVMSVDSLIFCIRYCMKYDAFS